MTLPVIDVTARDFTALVPILQARAVQKFPNLPQTDFNLSNFMQAHIDLFAGIGDGVHFYIDQVAQDLFWPSVRRRDNAIRLAALIGYRLPNATQAIATLRFTISQIAVGNVLIPARTQVKTNDPTTPITFETVAAAQINAGSLYVDVIAENATLESETFSSTLLADQTHTTLAGPYVEGSVVVEVGGDLTPWTLVDDFFVSKSTDKHYLIQVSDDDILTVIFGDGVAGLIPVGDVDISYKTGGGSAGNVFANSIKVVEASFTDTFSNAVTMTVTNPLAPDPGTDKQTVNQARFLAPRTVKTNQRTIAAEDFSLNALEVAGVSRARLFTANDDVLIDENAGFLYLVPVGAGTASSTLRDAVYDHLTIDKPVAVGFVLSVVSATFVDIAFTMRVYMKDPSFKAAAAAALALAFTNYFSETVLESDLGREELWGTPNPDMDFAQSFFNSVVEAVGQAAHAKIRNVKLVTDMEATYALTDKEFPRKGALVFLDGDTLLPLG